MKAPLRSHPKIRFGDGNASSWPPDWASPVGRATVVPLAGEGTLSAVEILEADRTNPPRLRLTCVYQGYKFGGTLRVDDAAIIDPLRDFLKQQIGKTIRQIGELEVDL